MKRLVTGVVLSAALAAATLTGVSGPAAATPLNPIVWGACSDPTLVQAGAQCGTLSVPLDHTLPFGTQITLALSRVKHKSPDNAYQGVAMSLPDALSGTGVNQSLTGGRLPNGAGDTYDWVGFAPRGLAPSVPTLSCIPDYLDFNRSDYVTTTPAAEQVWLDRVKGYADACAKNQPALLDHLKTTDKAADLESIRAALGVNQLNLFGQSYGTYLGQVYATLFPSHVRRIVLDSNVNPSRVWYGAAAFDQAVPLENNLRLWFDWLASHDDVYHLGATRDAVTTTWNAQLAKLRVAPADGAVGPDEWADMMLFTPYFQSTWPIMGSAFANYVRTGDGVPLKAMFSQFLQHGNDNVLANELAQVCTDAPWPANWSKWHNDSVATDLKAPDTTWGNTWANAPCFFWHAKAGIPVRVNGYGVKSALLVDETLDAATPFEGSLEVRSRFPGASLVSVTGGTNNAGSLSGNTCVDSKIAAYFATGSLPARKPGRQADVQCAPLPLPSPS